MSANRNKIKILDNNLTELATISVASSAFKTEKINSDNFLNFTIRIKDSASQFINDTNIIELDGNYYDIVFYEKKQQDDGIMLVYAECEHISYRLNKLTADFFSAQGTPAQILEMILSGSELSAGECELTEETSYTLDVPSTRRALLIKFVDWIGGELDYNGMDIIIREHRGSDTPKEFVVGKDIKTIVKSVNKRQLDNDNNPLVSYTLELAKNDGVSLGDFIIIHNTPLDINIALRIVSIGYDPYNPNNITIDVGRSVPDSTDDYIGLTEKVAESNHLFGVTSAELYSRIDDADGKISLLEQEADKITLLTNEVFPNGVENESSIIITAGNIVHTVQAIYNNPTTITDLDDLVDKNKIYYYSPANLYYYWSGTTWESTTQANFGTVFEQTSTGFKLKGNVAIDGNLITSGTISADRIATNIAQVNNTLNIGSSGDTTTQKKLTFNSTTGIQTASSGIDGQFAIKVNGSMLYTPKITVESGAAGTYPQLSNEGFYAPYPPGANLAQNFGLTDEYSSASVNLVSGVHTFSGVSSADGVTPVYRTTLNAGMPGIDNLNIFVRMQHNPNATTPYQAHLFNTWFCDDAIIITSDRNLKNTVSELTEKYDIFFDHLIPSTFKYNHGDSGRLHTGFIAQDVETALQNAEIPSSDFAGWVKNENTNIMESIDEDGNIQTVEETTIEQGLRYEEFIALNTAQIQKLKNRVATLETEIAELKEMIKGVIE